MKIVMLTLMFLLPLQSWGTQDSHVTALGELYGDLKSEDFDLVDHHYYINFLLEPEAIEELTKSKACFSPKSFKKSTPGKVTAMVRSDLTQAIEMIFDGADSYFDWMIRLGQVLEGLEQELTGTRVAICTDDSTPAYSDGHSVTYVKVNGRIKFAFETGHPD